MLLTVVLVYWVFNLHLCQQKQTIQKKTTKKKKERKKTSPSLEKREAWVCPPRLRGGVGRKAVSESPGDQRLRWMEGSLTSEDRRVSPSMDVAEQGSQGLVPVT